MQLAVVGSGYVGLVAAACLAETGNDVICVDHDATKVARLRENDLVIFEPGLAPLVRRNQQEGRLRFTTALSEAVSGARAIFIAVGTPAASDGSADLSQVLGVAEAIAGLLVEPAVIVLKSTVPVGTNERVREVMRAKAGVAVEVASNPEFLKEGAAVEDFMRPDRVVVGTDSEAVRVLMREVYGPFTRQGGDRLIFMDVASAEVTKYAANAMLATRISFMNQLAAFCEVVGADVTLVRHGIGSDSRIGRAFLYPGPGYGGSCFPKDLRALIRSGRDHGVDLSLLAAVQDVNDEQQGVLLDKCRLALGSLRGCCIAVWGLAFKAETDDVRESPALALIHGLLAAGATVRAHDPKATDAARAVLGDRVAFVTDPYQAADGADALVVATEWLVYRAPDFGRLLARLRRPVIIDGRNLYDPDRVEAAGFTYHGIGRRRP